MEAQNCGGEGTTAAACERNGQMDGCQLVGAPMMVSGGDGASASVELVVRALVKVEDSVVGSCGKRKRGRPPRGQAKPQPVKKEEEEEDVCFICFDGGSLVLCDRRGCPKAYHPACIKRDEAFFQSKAKWNCGWHICSNCQKASHYMCYTCTYSLCKACAKDADYLCVRENKGFCATCMRTVMLIENNTPGNKDMAQVDFDDKSSWEYLFKVYWFYLKGKLSLTLDELTQAKNPWKAAGTITCKEPPLDLFWGSSDGKSSNSDIPPGHMDVTDSKRIRSKGRLILPNNEDSQSTDKSSSDKSTTSSGSPDWASIELLEFVSHMKNGDISMLPQFDVQGLLLEYIKRNNLRDPRRKSQIICDSRLITLFGRPRVGHFEMLKLLEYHFLIKENNQKDIILSNAVRAVPNQVEGGGNNENLLTIDKEKKRKTRKKGEERGPQTNLDEYAAIDIHNINLIYLRRRLMESLIMDSGKFHDKVVGSIVRIRISICDPKQDMYRLVQVVGTFKAAVPYKLGEKTVDVMLEILNLDKKETVAVDAISNQEFSEDECRRLRQSIKCGLVKRLTVGQVQEKARALQEVRLNDWLETEMLRLNHLRDRASEKGRKKELRECVEKIELLKTPEERQRRLNENPEVHADPKMDPNCESDEDSGEVSKKKPAEHAKQRYSGFRKYGKESNSPQNKSTPTKFNLDKGVSSRLGEKMNELHKRKDACVSETPAVLHFTGSTPLANNSETDKLWHYRDPNGKIQGPFCMLQLRKWSTTGYFPHDMRVWSINNTEVDSLLLTDVLNGNFHKALPLRSKGSLPCQDVKSVSDGRLYNCEDRHSSSINPAVVNDGKRNNGSWNDSSATSLLQGRVHEDRRWNFGTNNGSWNLHGNTLYPTTGHENQSDSQRFSGQSSVESCRPLAVNVSSNNSDSNFSFASKAKSTDDSEHIKIDVLNLPSPTPPTSDRNLESQTSKDQKSSQSCGLVQGSGIEELPSPTPKMSDRDERADLDIQNLPISSPSTVDGDEKVDSTIQNSPSTSPNPRDGSEKVHADESKPPGTSSTSASSLVVDGGAQLAKEADEWGGYSPTRTKPPEVASDQAASPASKCDQFALPSQSDPPANTSHWQAIDYEPIEFSTLAEESVSDLLAEVDAMEAQGDLASPTSEMYSGDEFFENSKGDCFASICGFSYPLDSGKSDAWSSTGDSSLPYQSAMKNEPLGPAENDVSDPIKRCNGESSTSTELGIEMRHTEVSVSQMETGPNSQIPSEPKPMNSGLEDVNPCVGGSSQGMTNVGWETNPGLAQGNVNINHDTSFGFMGHERIGAPSDWVGAPWIRQPPYGVGTDASGGGVNYSRPLPKGQRVCKFYESGYCKKGAACNYLHP